MSVVVSNALAHMLARAEASDDARLLVADLELASELRRVSSDLRASGAHTAARQATLAAVALEDRHGAVEVMRGRLPKWAKGYGSGHGSGYGDGDGSGSGYGYGDGSGYGSGSGYGHGYGRGSSPWK